MSALVEFDVAGQWGDTHVCESEIRRVVRNLGLDFGRWDRGAASSIASLVLACAPTEEALRHLPQPFRIAGIEVLGPQGPTPAQARVLRRRYAQAHRLQAAEILHIREGLGLLYVQHGAGQLGLLCEAQDWVWLPAGTRCRLLLDASPQLELQRLLSTPGPWGAEPLQPAGALGTLPSLDAYVEQLLGLVGQEAE